MVCRDSKGKLWDDYDSLIDLIKSTVYPTTWDDVGGPGSIAPANLGTAKALVITQTYHVHCRIADTLAKIPQSPRKPPMPARLCAISRRLSIRSASINWRRPAVRLWTKAHTTVRPAARRNIRATQRRTEVAPINTNATTRCLFSV